MEKYSLTGEGSFLWNRREEVFWGKTSRTEGALASVPDILQSRDEAEEAEVRLFRALDTDLGDLAGCPWAGY